MSEFTPGPWSFYDDSNDGKTNRIEIVAVGKTVARIYHSVPAEDLPNARLIAAAPELLEAVKSADEVIDWLVLHLRQHHQCKHTDPAWSGIPAWINHARAAITKATGSTT